MAAFEIYKDSKNEFRFNLKADNGEKILHSEGYKDKGGAHNGINSVKENAPNDARYTRETATNGQFFFTLRAANHEVIGTSEMYKDADNRDAGIEDVKRLAPGAQVKDSF
ncbi:MAG: YegP family protein [Chloroflexi bacterium]|nr:YegP family protein [Chloroflexota bacterium]